jgi:hypothetical protein
MWRIEPVQTTIPQLALSGVNWRLLRIVLFPRSPAQEVPWPFQLLGSTHVSVPVADRDRRPLREDDRTKSKRRAERDDYHRDSLDHNLFLLK